MRDRSIAEAKQTATILAQFGTVLCVAKWNPDKGRKPRPFWEPSPPLDHPYTESWARAHQPTTFRDVAEILAAGPTQPPPTPIALPAQPAGSILITEGAGGFQQECNAYFSPGEIPHHPKALVNGNPASFQATELIRDSTGVRHARFRIAITALPALVTFADSPTAPTPIG